MVGRAGVERGENAGLAVGGDFGDGLEAGVAEELHGEFAAFVHAAIFGGDAGLANPFLQAVDGFFVALFDFFADGVEIVGSQDGAGEIWEGECCGTYEGGGCGGVEESAAIDGVFRLRFIDGSVEREGVFVGHGSPRIFGARTTRGALGMARGYTGGEETSNAESRAATERGK